MSFIKPLLLEVTLLKKRSKKLTSMKKRFKIKVEKIFSHSNGKGNKMLKS